MKNIQVIDGADNCTYDVYKAGESDFQTIFPGDGQDIEFAEDAVARLGEDNCRKIFDRIWKNRINKQDVNGIHGTLFFELENKKKYYPTKTEKDMVVSLD